MYRSYFFKIWMAFSLCLMVACKTSQMKSLSAEEKSKINFDLESIDDNGLAGLSTGKVSVDYEFCIPKDDVAMKKVQSIDPSIRLSKSKGRTGCSKSEILCIGNTYQKDWKAKLYQLAQLEFVEKINRTNFE